MSKRRNLAMAKVPFSKLQAKVDSGTTKLFYSNSAGEEICYEVKHYLPIQEKLELVSRIVNYSADDNNFYNPMKVKIFMVLEVTYAYTNLSFTEKMKEDPFKLYDTLVSTGIFTDIIDVIREKDWQEIQQNVWDVIKNIYDYKNSAAGIIDMIATDYSSINMDLTNIQEKLADPNSLSLVKEILPLANVPMD
jgi:hypothetical protein